MTLTVAIKHQFGQFTLDASFNNANNLGVIFGFSGAGKSVTLQMISGLRTPSVGKITLGDRILFDSDSGINIPPGERRIGYLFQDNTLFPHMTVRENI
ncbi:ATP-binding cassette domain-containing protein, partial [Myxococcota bacterium]|nr:ATP-binding cassette domain-containing protein [Myxococcota bacterium]